MGGNAIKQFGEAVRLLDAEYQEISLDIIARISNDVEQAFVIPSYTNKESHGDMDVIVTTDFWSSTTREKISDKLNAVGFIKNGEATSYAVPLDDGRLFQLDIISVPKESAEFAYHYFSYNDLGNLIGRVAHRVGFKFGHRGLEYIVRDPENSNHVVTEISVTKNFTDAIEFLGYDPDRFSNGFDSLDEIFEYAMSSHLATREIYLLENRNNTSRTRDRKRKTYMSFLKYLEERQVGELVPVTQEEKASLRVDYLKRSFKFYLFRQQYQQAMDNFYKEKKLKKYFNGKVVGEITGLSGKELSKFMTSFRESYGNGALFSMPKHAILTEIIKFKEEF